MVKQIIKEAMDQNPLGLKEAVVEELRGRVALALEAKMNDLEEAKKVKLVMLNKKGQEVRFDDGTVEFDTEKEARDYAAKDNKSLFKTKYNLYVNGENKGTLGEGLEEAKMTDAEVLSAAKSLAANGKDAKTKAFGKGLVDFYEKEGSFTPAQVGGLQNIMKNASFQMAKESVGLEEAITAQNLKDAEAVVAYAKSNKGKGIATRMGDNRIIPNIQIVRYLESIGKVKNVKELPSGNGWTFELKESVDLDEAVKKDKPAFGSSDGFSYAVSLNGVDNEFFKQPFGRQLDAMKKVKEFTANAKKGYVGAKGKSTLASVKEWVKLNQPTQFYAKWKSDSSSYKDDSVEIHYTK
jgi:hypothetical protein